MYFTSDCTKVSEVGGSCACVCIVMSVECGGYDEDDSGTEEDNGGGVVVSRVDEKGEEGGEEFEAIPLVAPPIDDVMKPEGGGGRGKY